MPNEKTIQVHTHRIMPGAECTAERPCKPMDQALRHGWLLASSGMPLGPDGKEHRLIAIGDWELGYLSVFRFCPFCGTGLEGFPGYAQFHEGPPVLHRHEPKGGAPAAGDAAH